MKRSGWLIVFFISVFGFLVLSVFSTGKFVNSREFKEKYAIFSLHVPNKIEFANEKVPIEFFDVKEGLDRELHVNTYFHSQTIFYLKRATRFFPEIERILKEEGVPDDLKYLSVAESGLTNAVSPSNAVGFWQFLKNTGKEYGLEINQEVDERYDLEKSTRAACKFLKESYKQYGSWAMAAASYNMGVPGLMKQVEVQKEKDYFNLYLNEETARYVFRILAIKLIVENPQLYGFYIDKEDLYPPYSYDTVVVSGSIASWADFAKEHNSNYKLLKLFNPWLRDYGLDNKLKKTYTIRIPQKGFRENLYSPVVSGSDSVAQNIH